MNKSQIVIYAGFEAMLDVTGFSLLHQVYLTPCNNTQWPTSNMSHIVMEYTSSIINRGENAAKNLMSIIVKITEEVQDIYSASGLLRPLTPNESPRHDHLTGNYIGPTCNVSIMLRRRPKTLPVMIHNRGYDQNFIIKELAYDSEDIFIIPNSVEK
ncbi:hypothetical protein PR048_018719 [Dryococelus australis]|uniref:Uncharacterized protein n=1 Tax=Dryococelus australis TaxID=614101 RepID=A0ABQ9HDG3_9NEOP|nr:hypothetical protein PR048_018719 [Dryococelus australis]